MTSEPISVRAAARSRDRGRAREGAFGGTLRDTAVTAVPAAVAIGRLGGGDRARWELLARGYKAFYETELADACHLQDLFVDPAARNRGVARALIEAVAATARERGAFRLYWHTHTGNATARALYDKVARHIGMIRYDRALDAAG